MILIHIITKQPEQVEEIVEMLINGNLMTDVTVTDTVTSFKGIGAEIETDLTNLLIGRTKAILFSKVEQVLKEKYGDNMPVIYGMPIINMDLRHLEKLNNVMDVKVAC
jgi:uncharacterized protein involved in tolerance to divalent cations